MVNTPKKILTCHGLWTQSSHCETSLSQDQASPDTQVVSVFLSSASRNIWISPLFYQLENMEFYLRPICYLLTHFYLVWGFSSLLQRQVNHRVLHRTCNFPEVCLCTAPHSYIDTNNTYLGVSVLYQNFPPYFGHKGRAQIPTTTVLPFSLPLLKWGHFSSHKGSSFMSHYLCSLNYS